MVTKKILREQKLYIGNKWTNSQLLQCKLQSVLVKGALTVRGQSRMSTMCSSYYHVVCSEETRSETKRVSWVNAVAKKRKKKNWEGVRIFCGAWDKEWIAFSATQWDRKYLAVTKWSHAIMSRWQEEPKFRWGGGTQKWSWKSCLEFSQKPKDFSYSLYPN